MSRSKRCGGNIGRAVVFITTGRPILRSADAKPGAKTLKNARLGRIEPRPYAKSLKKNMYEIQKNGVIINQNGQKRDF